MGHHKYIQTRNVYSIGQRREPDYHPSGQRADDSNQIATIHWSTHSVSPAGWGMGLGPVCQSELLRLMGPHIDESEYPGFIPVCDFESRSWN